MQHQANNAYPLPAGFQYTQSKLQDFMDCPRRFQLKYLEGQRWPAPVTIPQEKFEAAMQRGQRIHQMIERHQSGVSLPILKKSIVGDDNLERWLSRYEQLYHDLSIFDTSMTETVLSMNLNGYQILAKFDWLGVRDSRLVAIDWKTGKLPSAEQLKRRMQTVVYLLVLYRAGGALFNRMIDEFILRYVSLETREERIFTVTAASVAEFEQQILSVIEGINSSSFNKVESERPCLYCVYRGLCGRGTTPDFDDDSTILEWGDTLVGIHSTNTDMVEF